MVEIPAGSAETSPPCRPRPSAKLRFVRRPWCAGSDPEPHLIKKPITLANQTQNPPNLIQGIYRDGDPAVALFEWRGSSYRDAVSAGAAPSGGINRSSPCRAALVPQPWSSSRVRWAWRRRSAASHRGVSCANGDAATPRGLGGRRICNVPQVALDLGDASASAEGWVFRCSQSSLVRRYPPAGGRRLRCQRSRWLVLQRPARNRSWLGRAPGPSSCWSRSSWWCRCWR